MVSTLSTMTRRRARAVPAPYVDAERRSRQRSATILFRMSPEDRAALEAAAERRGLCLADLLRETVAPVIESEQRTA